MYVVKCGSLITATFLPQTRPLLTDCRATDPSVRRKSGRTCFLTGIDPREKKKKKTQAAFFHNGSLTDLLIAGRVLVKDPGRNSDIFMFSSELNIVAKWLLGCCWLLQW